MSSKTNTTATRDEATPPLVPKLRFPEFRGTEGWDVEFLGNICQPQQWPTISSNELVGEGYPVYGANGFIGYYTDFNHELETVAVTCRGSTCGEVSLIPPKSYITGNSMCLDGIDSVRNSYHFVYHLLKHRGFYDIISGSAQPQIVGNAIKRLRIALASKPEQQKIAECLISVDELMAAQARKVDALKTHKKGLMQQLFPREGETQPRLRFPEFRSAGEWEVKPLGKVAENLDNRRVPITSSDRKAGDVPYYGASGIVDYVEGFIFDEDLLCVSEDGANLVARTYPIAFPISGKTWVNNHAHVLRFEHACTQKFVEVYLNSIKLDDFITGMAQPKLNKAMLDRIPIPHPRVPEQQRIAACLSSLDALLTAETQKLEALKTHKKGLMQQLFPSPENQL